MVINKYWARRVGVALATLVVALAVFGAANSAPNPNAPIDQPQPQIEQQQQLPATPTPIQRQMTYLCLDAEDFLTILREDLYQPVLTWTTEYNEKGEMLNPYNRNGFQTQFKELHQVWIQAKTGTVVSTVTTSQGLACFTFVGHKLQLHR